MASISSSASRLSVGPPSDSGRAASSSRSLAAAASTCAST